eukprot:jgi/Ulvmu1/1399/UM011_0127.1
MSVKCRRQVQQCAGLTNPLQHCLLDWCIVEWLRRVACGGKAPCDLCTVHVDFIGSHADLPALSNTTAHHALYGITTRAPPHPPPTTQQHNGLSDHNWMFLAMARLLCVCILPVILQCSHAEATTTLPHIGCTGMMNMRTPCLRRRILGTQSRVALVVTVVESMRD